MNDRSATVEALKNRVAQFIEEREWQQFHSPKNLSMALASEVAELMDLFLWCDNNASYAELERQRQDVENEISDIAILTLAFLKMLFVIILISQKQLLINIKSLNKNTQWKNAKVDLLSILNYKKRRVIAPRLFVMDYTHLLDI